jgi:hypothetical protein
VARSRPSPALVLCRLWDMERQRARVFLATEDPKSARYLALAVVVFCAIPLLWFWPARYPEVSVILGADCVIMATLGGIVSTRSPGSPGATAFVIGLFVILGSIGMRAVIQQQLESDRAATEYRQTLKEIASSTAETRRIADLNTSLQAKLMQQSELIGQLAAKGIDTTTGGNSFCYMVFAYPDTIAFPTVFAVGAYPLYDVQARIVDLERLFEQQRNGVPLTLDTVRIPDTYVTIGSMAKGTGWSNQQIHINLGDKDYRSFNIFFSARNGIWSEALRMRRVNGKWSSAFRIRNANGRDNSIWKTQIDKDFPGKPDPTKGGW